MSGAMQALWRSAPIAVLLFATWPDQVVGAMGFGGSASALISNVARPAGVVMDKHGWPSFSTPSSNKSNPNFISAEQLWFMHESEKAEEDVKTARADVFRLESFLREQGAVREAHFENVTLTAKALAMAEDELSDAVERRKREHAATVDADAKRNETIGELKAVLTETWRNDEQSVAGRNPAEKEAVGSNGNNINWVIQLRGERRELNARVQDTWTRDLRRRQKAASPWKRKEVRDAARDSRDPRRDAVQTDGLPTGAVAPEPETRDQRSTASAAGAIDHARRVLARHYSWRGQHGALLRSARARESWRLGLGSATGELRVKLRGTLHRQLRREAKQTSDAAKQDQRADAALLNLKERIARDVGRKRSALRELRAQISASLGLSEEKSAELDASRARLRASTEQLEGIHLSASETPCSDKFAKRPFLL